MKLTKNINTGDEELVFRTISTSPKEHFEGRWKSGRLYPLYSVVVNNGTTFVSQNAKMKEEPYVIYDAVKQEFKANDGWKIKEMSADSRLTALGGGSAGGGVTPEDVAEMISGKQDTIEDLSAIRSGASAGATAYQKPNSGIPASDIASGVIPTDVVKYSLQTLTDAQKAEARANIEAQDYLVSGTNIKTVNGESILGSGNIVAGDPNAVKYTEQTLTDAQKTQSRTNIGAGTYSKPSGGIPASDIASGVIPTVPTISTDVSADAASDVKTSSPKSVKTYVDAGIAAVESDLSDLADEVEAIDIGAYVMAWDGNSEPVVANIPAGVSVTYNTTTYTGTLAASASTIQKIYLVATGTTDNYDRYITVGDSTYSWVNLGTTEITLADYATETEVSQLEAKVTGLVNLGQWEVGSINYPSNGHIPDLASDTRIRVAEQTISKTGKYVLSCNTGYKFVILVVGKVTVWDWYNTFERDLEEGDIYRIAIKTDPETSFSGYTQEQVNALVAASGFKMEGPGIQKEIDELSEEVGTISEEIGNLEDEINGIPGGPLSFTENSGGYYNTSGQYVQHSGKYAEIDLSRYAGQTLTLAITNASGSSTRATCLMVNGSVVSYILENDANFDRTWDIPENAVLRESHTAESTITILVSGKTPAILTDKYVFPKGFAWPNNPLYGHISMKRDGDIVSDLDLTTFKVQGGVTYYVSPSGNDSNSGLDAEHPLSNIRVAIEKSDVGTVILAGGLYNIYRLPSGSTAFTKSVNLVAASGATPIIAPYRSGGGWSKESGYNYVYAQGYGNSIGIVNLAKLDANGDYTPYTKVASIDEVEATENSWFSDSSKTYIHATEAVPDNTILNLENSFPIWADYSGNETLYLEGLTVIGGNGASCRVRNVGTGRPLLVARNCKFGYAKEGNALHLLSIDSICENCVCCYARADGFNYHKDTGNTALPRSIELGCIGRSNGFKGFYPDGTANTDNGSTSHDGGVAIRINGQYYDNIGPNVADAGDGQQSLNLGCVAHHSKAESTQACGFQMNGDGAIMFCDTCAAFSNPYNFRAEAGTKVKMRNCAGEPTNAEGGEIWAY